MAIAAAVMLGVHLSLSSNPVWDWTEVASLAALTVVFLVLHQRGFHRRWVSYRFLAERLRSARFLIPAGVEFQWAEALVAVYIERNSSCDWLMRAFHDLLPGERQLRRVRTRAGRHRCPERRLADDWDWQADCLHSQRSLASHDVEPRPVGYHHRPVRRDCRLRGAGRQRHSPGTMGFLWSCSLWVPSLGALSRYVSTGTFRARRKKWPLTWSAAQKTISDATVVGR